MLVVPVLRAERKQTAPVLVLDGAAHLYAAMFDDAGLARPQYLCDSRTLVKK